MATGTESRYQNQVLKAAEFRANGEAIYPGFPTIGINYFVDAKLGSDGHDGLSWDTPLLTMGEAFDRVVSGDTIYCVGKIKEQLTTPAGVFDVSIIGAANRPRHADNHTESAAGARGSSASTWVSPDSATASTPLLKIQQQGWRVVNMLFGAGPASTASVLLFRDGGAGDSERDASHAHIIGCRFSAPVIGIQDSGGCAFVRIEDCHIHGATTAAVNNVTGAGIGTLLGWQLRANKFHDNAIGVDLSAAGAEISGNTFGKFATTSLDLRGGSDNMVWGNALYGTYSNVGGYYAGTNDEWGGNLNSLSGGVTAADPA